MIIATRDRRHLLEQTLPTVLGQDYPAQAFEVVLVDDGSVDGTADWARSLSPSCSLEVLRQPAGGPAAARNRGIAVASGELLLFLDDDIACEPQLLSEHAAGHRAAPGGLVHGRIGLAPESPETLAAQSTRAWYEGHHSDLLAEGELRPDRHIFLNANTSFPAPVLAKIGGFDEEIPFPREDFELGLRVWKSGVRIRYRPKARAYEVFMKPSSEFVRDARAHAVADVLICRKHPEFRRHTALAASDPPSMSTAAARRVFRRLPTGSERLLDHPAELAERHIRRPRARRIGDRLLALQRQIVFDRAASRQAGSAAMLEAEFNRWLPALVYHRVGGPTRGMHPDLTVSPRVFRRQMAWLQRRGYTGIRPAEWQDWCAGHGTLPRRPVLITFDDAYADLTEHALPIVRSLGFGAAVFVVTERIGAYNDWDAPGDGAGAATMTRAQIVEWSRAGIEFGAHGRSHRRLSTLKDADMNGEVAGSRADLEEVIDQPVGSFAYPYGEHSDSARAAVRAAYDLAFIADGGVNTLTTPPELLHRAPGGRHDSGPELEWRAWTGEVPLRAVRDRLSIGPRIGA